MDEALITHELVQLAIRSLSLKKAAGPDGLMAEHFVHGPITALSNLIAPLFQAFLNLHFIPSSFNISHVIPIFKGCGLDPTNPSNYRGISIASVFSKLFELILLKLFFQSLSGQLHGLQGGFRSGFSTAHTSFILLESI